MGFDAIFVGVGAGSPAFLGIPGEFAGQVYSANEFLTRVNLMGGDQFPLHATPVNVGKSAVVIGAGNTAMDCLRVARRLGVAKVRCVYRRSEAEAPARLEELRHAKEEGIEFFFLHAPTEIRVDQDGNVSGMKVEEMELGEADDKGRRKPLPTGRFKELDCDTVIYALGTKANPIVARSTPGLAVDKRGNIAADEGGTQATSLPGVFAGGDIVSGGATVILAMGAGRRAARSIAAFLKSGKKWPVTREQSDAFVPPVAGAVCPKCRRPVEGDEAYVCCAGARLSWRCNGCGKVSEGFAFPYGMCPSCGDSLRPLEPRGFEGVGLEAIRSAFEIELGGMAFYTRAAKEAVSPELRELFSRFAVMEQQHMATLVARYHVEPPPPGDFRLDQAALYAGTNHQPDAPDNLFRIALAFEERAATFFEDRRARCAEGSAEAMLYQELAAEEREHVYLLATERQRFRAGKPGLL
jgi:glutamate synthase (NADPH/NADH) small chain